MVRGELYGAEQDFDSVLNHAENPDFVHFRQRILNNFGLVLLERGKLAEANSRLFEALAFVSGPDQVMIRANLTLASLEEGAYSEVARRVEDLERSNSLLQAGWAVLFANTMRGWIALHSGRMREAADYMRGSEEALADSALMMDSSYSESLIARMRAQKDPIAAAAYCDDRGAVHRRRYVLGALRLALEGARSLRLIAPEGARTRAQAVLAEAEALGASNVARQAVALLSESAS
jgi:hypothetical protein